MGRCVHEADEKWGGASMRRMKSGAVSLKGRMKSGAVSL